MSDPYGQQQPAGQPYGYGQQPYGAAPAPSGDQRPGTVTAAAWIAIVFSGLSAAAFGFGALALLVARDEVIAEMEKVQEFRDANIDADAAVGVLVVFMVGFVIWCVIAAILGIFVLRRSNVARILLVISASVAALFSLVGVTSGFSLIPLVACLATIVLLFVGGAGAWFKGLPAAAGGYPSAPYGGYGATPTGPYQPYGEQPAQQQPPQAGTDYPSPYGNPYGTPTQGQPDTSPNPYGQVPPTHQDPDQPNQDSQDGQDGPTYPPNDYPGR